MPVNIAIFASGGGSNALEILRHFEEDKSGEVALICSNKSKAGVLKHAADYKVKSVVMKRSQYSDGDWLVWLMQTHEIDLIVLAGYLKLIPKELVLNYPEKIVNIHPALLPAYGGKGMYGMNVHRAVIEAGEEESGITIHYVNEAYDEGAEIFKKALKIGSDWTAEELKEEVLKLEHKFFPQIIGKLCQKIHTQ